MNSVQAVLLVVGAFLVVLGSALISAGAGVLAIGVLLVLAVVDLRGARGVAGAGPGDGA